ncbi:MAG: TetR/AcrR family transcriptional regulator [Desulfobacterales bacterium]|jgi:TetR/AcrR family transcriptional regulator
MMPNINAFSTPEANARQRLLETATGLFAEKGYAGTSVREIVGTAGVSKPVLYYYFKSKEGLFYAILKWAADVQQRVLNEILHAEGSVLDRLIHFYDRIYEGIRQYKTLYILIHGLVFGPPQGIPAYDFGRFQRQMIDAVERIVAEGIAAGEIKNVDAQDVALLVLGILDFNLNMDMILPGLEDPQRPGRLLKLAFQGLYSGIKS